MVANLIDIRTNSFKGKDGKEVKGLIATFLAPSTNNKYCPNLISFWVHADSAIGQILQLSLCGVLKDGEHYSDIRGICLFDIAYKYDKNKSLQVLKYCKVKEN